MTGWTRALRAGVRTLPLLVLVSAAACDSGTEPVTPKVSGRWAGSSDVVDLELVLQEHPDGSINGGGTVSIPGQSVAVTVSDGTHVFPDVTLTLSASGFLDMNYSGEVSEEAMAGTLDGSGFNDFPLDLEKQ